MAECTKLFDIKSTIPMDLLTVALDTIMQDKFVEEFVPLSFSEMQGMCYVNRVICVGSFGEHLYMPEHIKSSQSDFDMFLVLNNLAADNLFGKNRKLPGYLHVARILSEHTTEEYPGYFRIDYDVEDDFPREKLKSYAEKWVMESFPERRELLFKHKLDKGPAIKLEFAYEQRSSIPFDFVPALYNPYWPEEAIDWITRNRLSNWPTKEMIRNISELGFHAVNKEPNFVENETTEEQFRFSKYWRISFSVAEVMISVLLNPVQRQCIRLMKIVNSILCGRILCSFHIKMLAFWIFEEVPRNYWITSKLGELFLHMIDKMLYYVIRGELPHYFIPKINLLQNVPRLHLKTLAKRLVEIRNKPMQTFINTLCSTTLFSGSLARQNVLAGNNIEVEDNCNDLSNFDSESKIGFINYNKSILSDTGMIRNFETNEDYLIDRNKLFDITVSRPCYKSSIFEACVLALTFHKLGMKQLTRDILEHVLYNMSVIQHWLAGDTDLPPSYFLEPFVVTIIQTLGFDDDIMGFIKEYLKLVKEKYSIDSLSLNVMEWYANYLEVSEGELQCKELDWVKP